MVIKDLNTITRSIIRGQLGSSGIYAQIICEQNPVIEQQYLNMYAYITFHNSSSYSSSNNITTYSGYIYLDIGAHHMEVNLSNCTHTTYNGLYSIRVYLPNLGYNTNGSRNNDSVTLSVEGVINSINIDNNITGSVSYTDLISPSVPSVSALKVKTNFMNNITIYTHRFNSSYTHTLKFRVTDFMTNVLSHYSDTDSLYSISGATVVNDRSKGYYVEGTLATGVGDSYTLTDYQMHNILKQVRRFPYGTTRDGEGDVIISCHTYYNGTEIGVMDTRFSWSDYEFNRALYEPESNYVFLDVGNTKYVNYPYIIKGLTQPRIYGMLYKNPEGNYKSPIGQISCLFDNEYTRYYNSLSGKQSGNFSISFPTLNNTGFFTFKSTDHKRNTFNI